MKKFFVFMMALCCSAVMFAGGGIFEAWLTYGVNGEAVAAHQVNADEVNLGIVNGFQIDSFFVKVWQEGGENFDPVKVGYKLDGGEVQELELKWKSDLSDKDREWAGELKKDFVAELEDGDHSLEMWFHGTLHNGENTNEVYMNNDGKNYKFNFTKGTPPEKVTSWAVIGSFNDWASGFALEKSEDAAWSTLIPVEANHPYEFKIIRIVAQGEKKDTTWFGLPEAGHVMTYASCSNWLVYETIANEDKNAANVGLMSTLAGDYAFFVDVEHKSESEELAPSISVNIPEPAPDTREKREVVLVPGDLKSSNPTMLVHAFTLGKEPFSATMTVKKEGEDTICYTAQVPQELDSLIFVRAATEVNVWEDLNWGEGGNVWNQTEDLKIECDTARFVDWVYDTKYFKVCWCDNCEKPIPEGAILFKSKAFDYAANMPFEKGIGEEYSIKVTYDKVQLDEFIIVTSEKLYKIAADAENMHRENCTDWTLVEDGENTKDVVINIDVPGDYTYIWKPAELKISVIYPEFKLLGDEYFIKLPFAEDPSGDWIWHDMEKDADTNLWSYSATWQDGGANIGLGKDDSSPSKYFDEASIDFGANITKPAVGTECKYIWNPDEQKLSVDYEKGEGIENVVYELDLNAPMFNILGVEVDNTFHGIVIQNGHKFIR